MPSLPYNDRAAKSAMPLGGQRTRYTVTGKPGLQLVVSPGHPEPTRRWYVRYQVGHGRGDRRRGNDAIGDLRHWSIGQAWEKASEIIRQAQSGEDPKSERIEAAARTQDEARTVAVVYGEWLDDPRRRQILRNRTREEYERIFTNHIEQRLGSIPIRDLSEPMIDQALEEVRKATTNRSKGWRGLQANKVHQILHAVCEFGFKRRYLDINPARRIEAPVADKNPEGRQSRPPSDAELRLLWTLAPDHMPAQHVRLLRLAFLLGKRVSEMLGTLKSELNLGKGADWFIPGSREGNKSGEDQRVPLPPAAVIILLRQVEASGDARFLFPVGKFKDAPMSRNAPSIAFTRFRRAVGIEGRVRFHDARGLISVQMAKLGVPSEYRSHVLHHTGDTRAALANSVYSTYDYEPQKRRALELWERRLLEIVEGRPASGERW